MSEVFFEDVEKALLDGTALVIDVREPSELANDGKIPGSHGVPLGEVKSAFQLPEEDFKAKYNFDKPSEDSPIVLSCRSGRRATNASELLKTLGYLNVQVYKGSFSEWVAKGGAVEKL